MLFLMKEGLIDRFSKNPIFFTIVNSILESEIEGRYFKMISDTFSKVATLIGQLFKLLYFIQILQNS